MKVLEYICLCTIATSSSMEDDVAIATQSCFFLGFCIQAMVPALHCMSCLFICLGNRCTTLGIPQIIIYPSIINIVKHIKQYDCRAAERGVRGVQRTRGPRWSTWSRGPPGPRRSVNWPVKLAQPTYICPGARTGSRRPCIML